MVPGRPQPGRLNVRYNHEAMNPGTRLGPYEIVSLLGAGGMGEVHRARDSRLQREVAIKVLPASFAHDATRQARFEPEARDDAASSNNWSGQFGIEIEATTKVSVRNIWVKKLS
jgi:serine/threonine protein kinase